MTDQPSAAHEIDAARKSAMVDLIPSDCHSDGETAAFDVVVGGMGLIGRWAQLDWGAKGIVTWTDGSQAETAGDADPEKVVEAVRLSIPIRVGEDRPNARKQLLRRLPGLRGDR